MKRIIVMSMCMFWIIVSAYAQTNGTIIGITKEKLTGNPLEYATITLRDAASDKLISGCMTDSVGGFVISHVSQGKYYIEASFIGCKTEKSNTFEMVKNVGVAWQFGTGKKKQQAKLEYDEGL